MPSSQDQNLGETMKNGVVVRDNGTNPNTETIPEKAGSSHVALYKCNSKVKESQRERRLVFLEEQRTRRSAAINDFRKISDLFVEVNEEDEPGTDRTDEVRQWQPQRRPRNKHFSKKLMQSEYFTDVPEDLEEKWVFKLCPEGKRCLLVAKGGTTKCYWRCGQEFYSLGTDFPGGGYDRESEKPAAYTILDCVIIQKLRIIFVFDVLAWNGNTMLNCTAQMRFYWLDSRFNEQESLCKSRNRNNPYTIMLVPWGPAKKSAIEQAISTEFKLGGEVVRFSGVLFYHEDGLYSTQRTPLVGWLLPCMLAELFNININLKLCTPEPPGYENIHSFVECVIAKKKARKSKKLKDEEMIDASATGEEEMEGEMTAPGNDSRDDSYNADMEIERVYQEAAELEMS